MVLLKAKSIIYLHYIINFISCREPEEENLSDVPKIWNVSFKLWRQRIARPYCQDTNSTFIMQGRILDPPVQSTVGGKPTSQRLLRPTLGGESRTSSFSHWCSREEPRSCIRAVRVTSENITAQSAKCQSSLPGGSWAILWLETGQRGWRGFSQEVRQQKGAYLVSSRVFWFSLSHRRAAQRLPYGMQVAPSLRPVYNNVLITHASATGQMSKGK